MCVYIKYGMYTVLNEKDVRKDTRSGENFLQTLGEELIWTSCSRFYYTFFSSIHVHNRWHFNSKIKMNGQKKQSGNSCEIDNR